MPRSPAPHAVQVKENGMGMRGSNELAFLLDCGAAHSGRLARGPVFRSGQPAALPAAVNPPRSPRDQVSLTLSALPPGSARPRSDPAVAAASHDGSGRVGTVLQLMS